MPKQPLTNSDKKYLKALGAKIEKIILCELKYSSLDKFALEHHNKITKPTLYAICRGKRDFQFLTISGLSKSFKYKSNNSSKNSPAFVLIFSFFDSLKLNYKEIKKSANL